MVSQRYTVKKIVVALSTRQKLLGTVSLYVRHFCPCNNTYQLIFHQLVERRAGISANSNYFGNSHSCQHSKCQNFCCSFPPTTNYVDATVSAAASWSKIFMYFAIIGSNLTCCREKFKCHWSKNSYHVDNFSKSGVVTELILRAIELEAFADKHTAITRAHATTTIDFLPATKQTFIDASSIDKLWQTTKYIWSGDNVKN